MLVMEKEKKKDAKRLRKPHMAMARATRVISARRVSINTNENLAGAINHSASMGKKRRIERKANLLARVRLLGTKQ